MLLSVLGALLRYDQPTPVAATALVFPCTGVCERRVFFSEFFSASPRGAKRPEIFCKKTPWPRSKTPPGAFLCVHNHNDWGGAFSSIITVPGTPVALLQLLSHAFAFMNDILTFYILLLPDVLFTISVCQNTFIRAKRVSN